MANANFYEELDLRYPEIAICIEAIDRMNPGTRKFYLPVLTPTVDTSSLTEKEQIVRQTGSTIANKNTVKVENITIQNYLLIPVPKELCGFVGGNFTVTNVGSMTVRSSGSTTLSGSTGLGGGIADHRHTTLNGSGSSTFNGTESVFTGKLSTVPDDRYIAKGSKWIVVFIGGDINKPQIIGRYTDPT